VSRATKGEFWHFRVEDQVKREVEEAARAVMESVAQFVTKAALERARGKKLG